MCQWWFSTNVIIDKEKNEERPFTICTPQLMGMEVMVKILHKCVNYCLHSYYVGEVYMYSDIIFYLLQAWLASTSSGSIYSGWPWSTLVGLW